MNANIENAMLDALNCGQISQETYDNFVAKWNSTEPTTKVINACNRWFKIQQYRVIGLISSYVTIYLFTVWYAAYATKQF